MTNPAPKSASSDLLAALRGIHSFCIRLRVPRPSRDQSVLSAGNRECAALTFELAAFLTRALWGKGFAVAVEPGHYAVTVDGAGPCRTMPDGAIEAMGVPALLVTVLEAVRETVPEDAEDGAIVCELVTGAFRGLRGNTYPL